MKLDRFVAEISWGKFLIIVFLALPLCVASLLSASLGPYQMISLNAAKVMPARFKEILMARRLQVFKGIDASQFPALDQATFQKEPAIQAVHQQVHILQEKLGQAVKFDEVAYEYGVLAKMISDMNDPTRFSANRELQQQFQKLLAAKHTKIPVVFYGYEDRLLKEKNLKGYLESTIERSQQQRDKLIRSYAAHGNVAHLADSDDRSPAFGIASLFYSHAVSDVANLWLYVWKEARGDMGGTPFYKTEEQKRIGPSGRPWSEERRAKSKTY
jgi:hypothetical protein